MIITADGTALMNRPVYTVTWVRGWDVHDTLKRLGVADVAALTWADLYRRDSGTNGHSDLVVVAPAGDWVVALQVGGWWFAFDGELNEVTRDGGEAVSVMRHDRSHGHFAHSVDGRSRTHFLVREPGTRWGAAPDALGDLIYADDHPDPDAAALALAAEVTGVSFTTGLFAEPLVGGRVTRSRLR
ncbi:DUF6461 domain-containing protein [Herbidospora sp. NBRC 101105]|uniref:DUF6461 domain-containing protein n=1 Tax=Herbidospora sp. NBRC 101105 TaxID=3032195 RepID=UPI00255716BF|nr:DUF6461 domain-containing protein [Herbidospora sp. NBRC 101105]